MLGLPVGDAIRKNGIGTTAHYRWKSEDGGLDASELRRTKEL